MDTLTVLTMGAGIALAALGGVFLAFSDFIMRSLARSSGPGGMEAMQMINKVIMRSVFMVLFIGLAIAMLATIVAAALYLSGPAQVLVITGAVLYVFGVFGSTAAVNVPLNNRLDAHDAASVAGQAFWTQTYLPKWTRWNSLRAVNCFAAAACLLAAGYH